MKGRNLFQIAMSLPCRIPTGALQSPWSEVLHTRHCSSAHPLGHTALDTGMPAPSHRLNRPFWLWMPLKTGNLPSKSRNGLEKYSEICFQKPKKPNDFLAEGDAKCNIAPPVWLGKSRQAPLRIPTSASLCTSSWSQ